MSLPKRLSRLPIYFAAVASLTACGGGGSDTAGPPPPPPPPPPPAGSITLTGVVARGAALANASVAVTCATGNGTATTSATGGYSVAITGGALPCVLRATSSDNSLRLHSVAPAGSATSVTANVTPLTELVVARLTGAEPAAYVAGVSAGTLGATVTAAAVSSAQASVASTLSAGGVNTSTAGDFISGPLVAASTGVTGNAYDLVLDALNARLTTAGTTLAALTTTIASGSPVATPAVASSEPTLPADLLLKPKASNCASAASTSYRLIKQAPSPTSTVTAVDTVDFDAPSLTLRLPGTTTVFDTLTPNGNCRYTGSSGADIVVSPAGVLVARATLGADDTGVATSARGTTRMIVGLPVQAIAVADLAGTWNTASWELDVSTYAADGLIITIGSTGAITQLKCGGNSAATPESGCSVFNTLLPAFSANSAGGFNITSTDPADPFTDRAFAYRAGNGDLMGVYLTANGSLGFFTKQRTLTLPALNALTSVWNVDVNINAVAPNTLSFNTHTVASLNTGAASLVRNTAANGSTVTVPQTLQYNVARNGYIYRPAATVTNSSGASANVREAYLLPLRGFGLTPYYLPATTGTGALPALFGLSVARQP